jgi:hypothetical protein
MFGAIHFFVLPEFLFFTEKWRRYLVPLLTARKENTA